MLISIIVNFLPILIAIILHEVAHGYVAFRLGDNTAKNHGRLSLNPIKHVDVFGTLILPALLVLSKAGFVFGWAKPVPINFNALKNPKRDVFLVSIAGIVVNIILAIISALMLNITPYIHNPFIQGIFGLFLLNMVVFNIVLAVFNALPIPPLDGSKIFLGWINQPWAINYINSGKKGLMAIVLIAFVLPAIGDSLGINLNIFGLYLIHVSRFFISFLV